MTKLRSVDLKHRVELRRPVIVRDPKGGKDTHFELVDEVWAEVKSLDGRESVMDHIMEGESVYRVRIRPRTDIGASWQIGHGALELNITAPPSDPDGDNDHLVIIASSKGALKGAAA